MPLLIGENISLRALESDDLDFLFAAENNEVYWEVSETQVPYSKYVLNKYLENAHQDIYEAKQFRFVICNSNNIQVGFIDLYDFNPQHQRVGVGILIIADHQRKGYASEAIGLISEYAFSYLNVHQVFANITADNESSIELFEKHEFKPTGIKKDWNYYNGQFKDEITYQLLKKQL